MLQAYEQGGGGAEKTIRDSITDSYQGLRPEAESIRRYEQEQLPAFYDAFSGFGMGTTARDLDPLTRLQHASRDAAGKATQAMTSRDMFDTRKARMEDLISSALRSYQTGYGMTQAGEQRQWRDSQAEEDKRRWEAEMELRRQAANRQGTPPTVMPDTPTVQSQLDQLYKAGIKTYQGQTITPVRTNIHTGQTEYLLNAPSTPTRTTPTSTSTPQSGYGALDDMKRGWEGYHPSGWAGNASQWLRGNMFGGWGD